MRILHTSDWHIGKKLISKPRLEEQKKTLAELAYICKNAKVDAVIVSGDCFDTFVPSAEAEELFYFSALEIAKYSRFIAIAGNHDDNQRFAAPRAIAKASGIFLIGGLDNSFLQAQFQDTTHLTAGEGWLRIPISNQSLNLALLPYPSLTRIPRLGEMEGELWEDKIKSLIDLCLQGFTDDGVNVFCSHLFMSGSEASDGELGGAQMLPTTILPNACYNALGHIHKPQTISKSKNAFYSGSLLNYSFDDIWDKRYILIDTDGKNFSLEDIPITTGKKTVRVRAASMDEAMDALNQNQNNWVELTYFGAEPLRPSFVARLRAHECFCKLAIESVFVKKDVAARQSRSTVELFCDFYQKNYGSPPDDSIVSVFLKVIAGEEI